MIWALGALLLQIPAIPQIVVPPASMVTAEASDVARGSEASVSEKLMIEAAPVARVSVALEPGRLTPSPVSPDAASAPASSALPSPAIAPVIANAKPPAYAGYNDRRRQMAWMGLAIVQHSAAAFDAWSTRRAISSGRARELNPMLKPFAGNASIYAATQVGPTLLDLLGRRMMNSRHGWIRHTWWLPQVLGTAASVAGGVHNMGVR
jgi:hypothetical protein